MSGGRQSAQTLVVTNQVQQRLIMGYSFWNTTETN